MRSRGKGSGCFRRATYSIPASDEPSANQKVGGSSSKNSRRGPSSPRGSGWSPPRRRESEQKNQGSPSFAASRNSKVAGDGLRRNRKLQRSSVCRIGQSHVGIVPVDGSAVDLEGEKLLGFFVRKSGATPLQMGIFFGRSDTSSGTSVPRSTSSGSSWSFSSLVPTARHHVVKVRS